MWPALLLLTPLLVFLDIVQVLGKPPAQPISSHRDAVVGPAEAWPTRGVGIGGHTDFPEPIMPGVVLASRGRNARDAVMTPDCVLLRLRTGPEGNALFQRVCIRYGPSLDQSLEEERGVFSPGSHKLYVESAPFGDGLCERISHDESWESSDAPRLFERLRRDASFRRAIVTCTRNSETFREDLFGFGFSKPLDALFTADGRYLVFQWWPYGDGGPTRTELFPLGRLVDLTRMVDVELGRLTPHHVHGNDVVASITGTPGENCAPAQWLTNGCFHLSWREYDITRAYYRVSIDVDGKWRIAEPPQIASHDAVSGWSFSAEAAPDCRHRIRFDNNEAVVPFDKASMAVLCRRSAAWR